MKSTTLSLIIGAMTAAGAGSTAKADSMLVTNSFNLQPPSSLDAALNGNGFYALAPNTEGLLGGIQQYNSKGNYIGTIPFPNTAYGTAVASDGNDLYLLDSSNIVYTRELDNWKNVCTLSSNNPLRGLGVLTIDGKKSFATFQDFNMDISSLDGKLISSITVPNTMVAGLDIAGSDDNGGFYATNGLGIFSGRIPKDIQSISYLNPVSINGYNPTMPLGIGVQGNNMAFIDGGNIAAYGTNAVAVPNPNVAFSTLALGAALLLARPLNRKGTK